MNMTCITSKKNPTVYEEILGYRFLYRKLRKPNNLLKTYGMRLHCIINFVNCFIQAKVFSIHSYVKSVDFSFPWNPGHIGRCGLKHDDFRSFWEIRVYNAID